MTRRRAGCNKWHPALLCLTLPKRHIDGAGKVVCAVNLL